MVTEHDNVLPDEYVLRRVLIQADCINLDLRKPVQETAFRPTNQDVNGISVYRELFTTPEAVAREGRSPKGYYVLRIPVNEILALGLTVVENPDENQLPGHCLIPEVNVKKRGNRDAKRELKVLQQSLADLINKDYTNRIVCFPG